MNLFYYFMVLLFVAMVYGDDYDDVTEDSGVEVISPDAGSYEDENSGNVTDYYEDDFGSIQPLPGRDFCMGKFIYGRDKSKTYVQIRTKFTFFISNLFLYKIWHKKDRPSHNSTCKFFFLYDVK